MPKGFMIAWVSMSSAEPHAEAFPVHRICNSFDKRRAGKDGERYFKIRPASGGRDSPIQRSHHTARRKCRMTELERLLNEPDNDSRE